MERASHWPGSWPGRVLGPPRYNLTCIRIKGAHYGPLLGDPVFVASERAQILKDGSSWIQLAHENEERCLWLCPQQLKALGSQPR